MSSMKQFKVVEMVGKGSFASVYKVIRKSDNKVYALKRVKMNKMSKKEISDALNEVRFLASIRHQNIVGFYEAFVENNESELCIIMEYCGCGDLAQKVERYKRRRQYMNEQVIWIYIIQVLRALQLLHGKGICHRDLKAANTFLAEDGSVKIGDMNVSKQLKYGPLNTQIGTPYYMSPEIWSNRPYDEKCDIWSVGCMIYELASLRPPFLGDSFPALKRAVLAGRYPALPRVYSEALTRVIAAMLQLQPRDRPNAQQLLAMPEIASRLNLAGPDCDSAPTPTGTEGQNQNVLRTIKVPQVLSRLNDVLPKPCYPVEPPAAPRSLASNAAVKPPLPPIPGDVQPSSNKENANPSRSDVPVSRIPQPPAEPGLVPQPPPPAPSQQPSRPPHRLMYQHRYR
eukprot:gene2454-2689_t